MLFYLILQIVVEFYIFFVDHLIFVAQFIRLFLIEKSLHLFFSFAQLVFIGLHWLIFVLHLFYYFFCLLGFLKVFL